MSQALATVSATEAEPGEGTEQDGGAESVEARARRLGWRPQAEYRGDPERWVDAETFIRIGEEELPVIRARNKRLEDQVQRLERTVTDSARTLNEISERWRNAEKRGYERAKAELLAERERAVEAGDTAAFKQADQRLQQLDEDHKPAPQATTTAAPPAPAQPDPATAPPPEVVAFAQRNPWFMADPQLNAEAQDAFRAVAARNPTWTLEQSLAEVERRVKAMFPDRTGGAAPRQQQPAAPNPRRQDAPAVSPSGEGPGRRRDGGRSFDAMPQESKDAYGRYVKMLEGRGKPLSKEEWAADYWAQEA